MTTHTPEPDPYPQMGIMELRKAPGAAADQVAQTGTPIILTRDGVPMPVMLAPTSLLRPDALPPAYFDAETRARGAAAADAYLAEEIDPDAAADALAWAERLDDGPGQADQAAGHARGAGRGPHRRGGRPAA